MLGMFVLSGVSFDMIVAIFGVTIAFTTNV